MRLEISIPLKPLEAQKVLDDFVANQLASVQIETLPTTDEVDTPYHIALIVNDHEVPAFETLLPEAIGGFQKSHEGYCITVQEMVQAPSPPFFAQAEKTAGGWTVDGVEMIDILSPD